MSLPTSPALQALTTRIVVRRRDVLLAGGGAPVVCRRASPLNWVEPRPLEAALGRTLALAREGQPGCQPGGTCHCTEGGR